MNRTTMLAALAVVGLGALLYSLHLEHFERQVTGGQTLGVLVLMRDLRPGESITRDALGSRQVPTRYVEDRHVRVGQLPQVLGATTRREVGLGSWLTWDDLDADARDRAQLSEAIPEGMRAFTVLMDSQYFGQMVAAGDRVDVLFTAEVPEDPNHRRRSFDRRKPPRVTTVLLQNVRVMAVGTRRVEISQEEEASRDENDPGEEAERRNRRARDAKFITLGLSLTEAVYLQHAIKYALTISLAVRNPEDGTILSEIPVTTDLDLIEAEIRERVQRERPSQPVIERID